MITLITGVPGTGKTALAVQMMNDDSQKRLVYSDGIRELKVKHEPVPHIDEWVKVSTTVSGAEEYEWLAFPAGCVIYLDECQRFFRPRHVSQKPPAAVAGFETHRHAGLDFVLMTQDITFLDSNVRKLIDKHIHIQDSWLGRFSYTWMRAGDPTSKVELKAASRSKYKPPASSFPLYKSAELHTERKKPMPILVPVGIVCGVLAIYLGYRVVSSVSGRSEALKAADPKTAESKAAPVTGKQPNTAWRVIGWRNGQQFELILSDGVRRRIATPTTFKRQGRDIEATLVDGTYVTTWGSHDKK